MNYQVVRGVVEIPDRAMIDEQRRINYGNSGFGARMTKHISRYRVGSIVPGDALLPGEGARLVRLGVLRVVDDAGQF
jgi:hypothetical protein